MGDSRKQLKGILDKIDTAFKAIDGSIYVLMILVVLLQIFARVCLPKVPAWTEEVSRYLQVYLVAFGAGTAIKHDAFVKVETIFHYLGEKAGIYLQLVSHTIILILFLVFFRYSIDMYQLGIPKSAVSMPGITMNVIYFSMLLMSGSAIYATIRKQIELIYKLKKKEV